MCIRENFSHGVRGNVQDKVEEGALIERFIVLCGFSGSLDHYDIRGPGSTYGEDGVLNSRDTMIEEAEVSLVCMKTKSKPDSYLQQWVRMEDGVYCKVPRAYGGWIEPPRWDARLPLQGEISGAVEKWKKRYIGNNLR